MGSVTAPENIRWLIPAWAWFALVVWGVATASCGDVRFVIPSEVEDSLDISDHAAVENIKRDVSTSLDMTS
jgi:hypothetical protein